MPDLKIMMIMTDNLLTHTSTQFSSHLKTENIPIFPNYPFTKKISNFLGPVFFFYKCVCFFFPSLFSSSLAVILPERAAGKGKKKKKTKRNKLLCKNKKKKELLNSPICRHDERVLTVQVRNLNQSVGAVALGRFLFKKKQNKHKTQQFRC